MGRNKKKKGNRRRAKQNAAQQTSSGARANDAFNISANKSGTYNKYKQATKAFMDGLENLLPSTLLPLVAVSDLGNAVDHLLSQNGEPMIPSALMKNLNESIQFREEAIQSYGDNDEGHKYMVGMLMYCHSQLKKCCRLHRELRRKAAVSPTAVNEIDGAAPQTFKSRFEALSFESDEDESEDENGEVCESRLERPPTSDREYSIENDLIEGTDYFRAACFLSGLNDISRMVHDHYSHIKGEMNDIRQRNNGTVKPEDNTKILTSLLRATTGVNMAIEEVRYMEETLKLECPHLSTFYHVLAVTVMHDRLAELEAKVDPAILASNPHVCLDFVAESIEHGFRIMTDPTCWRLEQSEKRFAEATGVGCSYVGEIASGVRFDSLVEVLPEYLEKHELMAAFFTKHTEQLKSVSHTWLEELPYLSGDKSILHTHSLLQSRTHDLEDTFCDECYPVTNSYGPTWNEREHRAKGTSDERMDELLMCDLLPELFLLEFVMNKVIEETHLTDSDIARVFPLLRELTDYAKAKDAPVSISMSFAVHAMLTGTLCLQGDGDLQRLALLTKFAYNTFLEQNREPSEPELPHLSTFRRLLIPSLEAFRTPLSSDNVPQEMRTLWNPLVGGSLLLIVEFIANLQEGVVELDSDWQATVTLHLYNALRKRNLIKENGLLELLSKCCSSSKKIWTGGSIPNRGSFTKNYMQSIGISPSATKKTINFLTSSSASKHALETACAPRVNMLDWYWDAFRERKITTEPSAREWSASYRMFMERDFSCIDGCERKSINSDLISVEGVNATVETYADQSTALFECMSTESDLLSLNWPHVGRILKEFLLGLVEHLARAPAIDEEIKACFPRGMENGNISLASIKREILLRLLVEAVFSELDFEDETEKCVESVKVSEYMTSFFQSVDKGKLRFL